MNFLASKISRKKLDRLISDYRTGKRVLEIGARGRPDYVKYFPNRVGVDIKPGPGVDVIASVYDLPFEDGDFDMVLCLSVLEHLEEPKEAIRQMRRVLKNEGKLIISTPFIFPIHNAPDDFWRFTKYGLLKLFSDGWRIEKICAETNTKETFAVLLQRIGYQTKMIVNRFSKLIIFLLARFLEILPDPVRIVYGDIKKITVEPEAFASAYFLVAQRTDKSGL